jgi:hypothetical protein
MALITLPAEPTKGESQSYSLNFTELAGLVNDSYFTDQSNLRLIEVVYQSSTSNQIELIAFTPSGATSLTSNAEFSLQARDIFDLVNVVLIDKQNGRYAVSASEIPSVANYKLDFTPAPMGQYVRIFSDTAPTQEALTGGAVITDGFLAITNSGGDMFIARLPAGPLTSGSGQAKVQLWFKDNLVGNSMRISYNTGAWVPPATAASMQAQVNSLGYAEVIVDIVNSSYYFNTPSLELRNVYGDTPGDTDPVFITQIIINKI